MEPSWKYFIVILILIVFLIIHIQIELYFHPFASIPFIEHIKKEIGPCQQDNTIVIEQSIYKETHVNAKYTQNALSFLDAPYYQSKIFKSEKSTNKFLTPYIDFMSFNSKLRFNYIYFDHNYNNPQIIHCSGINKAGIGNFLAQYWAARSIAFWLGYNFQMVQNDADRRCWQDEATITEMFDKYFNNNTAKKYWSFYLPKHANTSIYDTVEYKLSNIDRNRIYLWITQSIIQIDKDGPKKYLYKSLYRLFYYNPIFMNILITETSHALDLYFDPVEHNKNILPDAVFNSDKDIVIHFRCGDILSAGGSEYGFMTISYFKIAFDLIQNELDMPFESDTRIFFVSQLGENSLRADVLLGEQNLERKNLNGCRQVVYKYVEALQNLVSPANITINGNNPLNVDFYRMVHAPVLICSMSTFCEEAGQANTNNVILPMWGPWNDLNEMINGEIWYPQNHHFIQNSVTNLTLTSMTINKRKMNVQHIIDYLLSH